MKNKYKRFVLILRFLQDAVHSSYNRALGGQERRSLRQHMQVNETRGGISFPGDEPSKKGGIGSWLKKR